MSIELSTMDAATKLAFAQATGQVLLTKVDISTFTQSFDLALPTGYSKYRIEMSGVYCSFDAQGAFGLKFSADGGSTFADNYRTTLFTGYGRPQQSVTVLDENSQPIAIPLSGTLCDGFDDTFIYIADGAIDTTRTSSGAVNGWVEIYPGSADTSPSMFSAVAQNGLVEATPTREVEMADGITYGSTGPANVIRLQVYDTTVETSGFTRGTFRLFGVA